MKSLLTPYAVLLFLGLLLLDSRAFAWDSGLITEDYKNIKVTIRQMTEDGKKLGLSTDLIRSEVESQLKNNNLDVTDKPKLESLNVMVIVSSSAYSVEIAYERMLGYFVGGKTYYVNAKAWHVGSTGTHGGDVTHIKQILAKKLDMFIAQYVSDNERVVSTTDE